MPLRMHWLVCSESLNTLCMTRLVPVLHSLQIVTWLCVCVTTIRLGCRSWVHPISCRPVVGLLSVVIRTCVCVSFVVVRTLGWAGLLKQFPMLNRCTSRTAPRLRLSIAAPNFDTAISWPIIRLKWLMFVTTTGRRLATLLGRFRLWLLFC